MFELVFTPFNTSKSSLVVQLALEEIIKWRTSVCIQVVSIDCSINTLVSGRSNFW